MSFLTSLPAIAIGIMAAVPLGILLLYFLKLRRQPVEVPSTYLWSRTIEDLHVNSLMQRLRSNLLLFLQILAAILALLAIFRPSWQGTQTQNERQIFLLDASASMQATDVDASDGSRFDQAKRLIRERIDAMQPNHVAMLIAFSDREEILQPFTNNKYRLRQALEAAKVSNHTTDIRSALQAASGLANPGRIDTEESLDTPVADAMPADLFLFSDGGFPDQSSFDPGNLRPNFIQVGSDQPDNLSITAFNVDRLIDQPEMLEVIGRVKNYTDVEETVTVTLMRDSEVEDAQEVTIQANGETGVGFSEVLAGDTQALRMVIERDDTFMLDNTAYAGVAPLRNVSVLLITSGNPFLEAALATPAAVEICSVETRAPDFMETDEFKRRSVNGSDDLVIFDRCSPDEMPESNTCFIGSVPPEGWKQDAIQSSVFISDRNQT
ncbi:MAG: BatA and WFA domain-containing protein, partial [Planctomycetota bacterium]